MFRNALKEAFVELSTHVIGWDDILTQTMYALCTREHAFWISAPGRAKTLSAKMIFGLFPDARQFSVQVTKDMVPSAIFGNEIPDEYIKSGKEIFNLNDGICTAHLAYLDEFLDGPDFLVRSLNTVLNERRFERKDQSALNLPLHSGIMTTNFDRYGNALEAVKDRMMCKAIIPRVGGIIDRFRMYNSYLSHTGHVPKVPKLSFDDLREFAERIESAEGMKTPPEVLLVHGLLIDQYIQRRIVREKGRLHAMDPKNEVKDEDVRLEEITPRTEAKLHDFSRACALLDGRTTVSCDDLHALRYGLVTTNNPDDSATWEDVVNNFIPRTQQEINRLKDMATIVAKIAELKSKRPKTITGIAIQFAGKVETYTRITILELIDRITMGSKHDTLRTLASMVKTEIATLPW